MVPLFIDNGVTFALFFFFTFFLLCLIVGIIFYYKNRIKKIEKKYEQRLQKQRKLLFTLKEISQEEQKNMAANLHDDISMALNLLRLNQSKIIKNYADKKTVEEIFTLNTIIIDETLEALKSILNNLMPPTLIKLGLIKGINELCYKINAGSLIKIVFVAPDIKIFLSKTKELCLYRLIKELITNIIKHSAASQIEISVNVNESFLFTEISHDGKGISMKKAMQLVHSSNGMGLKNIFTRAELSESEINYITEKDKPSGIIIKTKLNSYEN